MHQISIMLLAGAVAGVLYAGLAVYILFRSFRSRTLRSGFSFIPPVSIFKPLKGLDENLKSNLESFFQLDYPEYELVFGVNDLNDPAIGVVQELQAAFPEVASRLVVDTYRQGYNPKVNNLCNIARQARYGHWVISDSNVRVSPNYLSELVAQMSDSRVGLVTSVIRGVGGRRLGACLENLHLNSFIAGSALTINQLSSIPVSIGKSMLLRRETMTDLGGFEAYANFLLEDGLIGQHVRRLGLETRICMQAVENVNDSWTVKDFLSRHYRWGLMRRHLNPWNYLTEILAAPIFLSVLALLLSPTLTTATVALLLSVSKVVLDMLSIRLMGGAVEPSSLWLLPFKELLIAAVWWKPFFTNRVSWRGNNFCIGAMTRITPAATSPYFGRNRLRQLYGGFAQTYHYTRRRLAAWGTEA